MIIKYAAIAVEPKVGLPVEHGDNGVIRKLKVSETDPVRKTFTLENERGHTYTTDRPNKELVEVWWKDHLEP